MKRVPQTMLDTLARLAIEFDRTSEQDTLTYYQEKDKAQNGPTMTASERAAYNAGWSSAKSQALEQALRVLVPDEEWDSTTKRWCETYERLAGL